MSKPTPTEIRKSKRLRFEIANSTGQKRKFIVSQTESIASRRARFFLSTLDPEFLYVGEFNPENGELRVTGNSEFDEGSDTFKIGAAALAVIFGRRELPEGFEIRKHEKGG